MSRIEHIRLEHVKKILAAYGANQPLHQFLKGYFRTNKQIGSKDRKFLRAYTYAWFRLGYACQGDEMELRLAKAIFMSNEKPDTFFVYLSSLTDWLPEEHKWTLSVKEKLRFLQIATEDVFPYYDLLSNELAKELFVQSIFSQPYLWLRALKGKEVLLEEQLNKQQITFVKNKTWPLAYALPNGSNVDVAGLAEVQDLSSQKVGKLIKLDKGAHVWDCCVASGGKTLMLADKQEGVNWYVSDVRDSMMENMHQRFKDNKLKSYAYARIDLSRPTKKLSFSYQNSPKSVEVQEGYFDLIVIDAPCSGSGTWARTPEQIQTFAPENIQYYVDLQKQIVNNAFPFLKPGGQILYITCSVFAAENETQVTNLAIPGLHLQYMELLQGMHEGADSMFIALLGK